MYHTRREGILRLAGVDLRDSGEEPIATIGAALQFQHRFVLHAMHGALLPPQWTLHGHEVILDVLCGSGSWCIDVSQRYPEAEVWGIDPHPCLAELAVENTAHRCSEQLHFQVDNCMGVFPFAPETFDVIHLFNGTSFFPLPQWSPLMAEMVRMLKPGGWLNLVDVELGAVSQPTVDRVLTVLGQLLATLNRSSAPDGKWPVTGSTLGPHRMAEHNLTEVGYQLTPLDLGGWKNQAGRRYLIRCLARPEVILSLAAQTGIGTAEELRLLVRQAQREVQRLDFCGVGMLVSTWGRKLLQPLVQMAPYEA